MALGYRLYSPILQRRSGDRISVTAESSPAGSSHLALAREMVPVMCRDWLRAQSVRKYVTEIRSYILPYSFSHLRRLSRLALSDNGAGNSCACHLE